jgi:hypothetical protein
MRFGSALICLLLSFCSLLSAACTTNNTYVTAAGGKAGAAGSAGSAAAGAATNAGQGGDTSAGGGAGAGAAGAAGGSAGGNAVGAEVSYEAEDAFHGGNATLATSTAGFSGDGYLDALGVAGARLVFAVNVAADGPSDVSLQYANAGASKVLSLQVNGGNVGEIALPTSSDFTVHQQTLSLRRGLNTIALVNADGSSSTVSLDKLDLTNGAPRPQRGAIRSFAQLEAEAGESNGSLVAADRTYGTVAAEASGREAVRLDASGKFVEWVLDTAANALVVRYSMPDAAEGGGTTGTLSLYVDGEKRQALGVSSKYAWIYGPYPFQGKPSDGSAHRYFDESRFLVGDLPAGSTIRLQRDEGDADVTIDFIDVELAPAAYAKPEGALSLADFGAQPDDGVDDADALRDAIAAAQAEDKEVFVPPGVFELKSRVDVEHVTIRGAGPWHSIFAGAVPSSGFNGAGDGVQLLDFAIFGDVQVRVNEDFDSGLDGNFGAGLLVQNLWIEHTKTGIWLIGPTSDAYVVGCRIRDTIADGVNFHKGVRFAAVEHTDLRNTGDDALAMYSEELSSDGNRFRFDTVRLPLLGNGAAIYGGADNSIQDLDIADTVTAAAGIAVSTRFDSTLPLGGTTLVARNTLLRTGGHEPNWNTDFGGLWIYADPAKADITAPIVVRDLELIDSTYQGVLISDDKSITQLKFERVTIDGAGSYGIEVKASGSATFDDVSVAGTTGDATSISPDFEIVRGEGNSGW